MRVYLCGPIHGCTDAEVLGWRAEAARWLEGRGHEAIDPTQWDFRGREAAHVHEIVELDLAAIGRSDALLVNGERPGWGTAMEVRVAHEMRLPVHAFCGGSPSPWLAYHAQVHPTMAQALTALDARTTDPNDRREQR